MEDDARLFRLNGVHRAPFRKTPPELHHALRQTNLSQLLIVLFPDRFLYSLRVQRVSWSLFLPWRMGRRIVYYLLVQGLISRAEGGVIDGQEAELGGNDPSRLVSRSRHGNGGDGDGDCIFESMREVRSFEVLLIDGEERDLAFLKGTVAPFIVTMDHEARSQV